MLEVVMRRRDDHADDQIDQTEDEADEPAQCDPPVPLLTVSRRSSATCEPHDRHDDEHNHEDPDDAETSNSCKHVSLPSLLRGVRIEYVFLMYVHEVLGQSQLRVELLAANVTHANLVIASLFVLLGHR